MQHSSTKKDENQKEQHKYIEIERIKERGCMTNYEEGDRFVCVCEIQWNIDKTYTLVEVLCSDGWSNVDWVAEDSLAGSSQNHMAA